VVFVAFGACVIASAAEERIDNVPMYGQPQIARPDALRKADEDFIREAVAGLGSREAASRAWFEEGERFMAKREFDFAMRRYNQSWLLNPENYQPYWGFGRVLLESGNAAEAIRHLERAKVLATDQYQRPALIADLATAYSVQAASTAIEAEKSAFFERANQNFSESVSLDPKYGNGWRRWAFSLYEEGRFSEAWTKVRAARENDAKPFPPAFLRALEQKAPEPK
jgi:tetratricopeptide (TPR) repeat protein